MLRIGPSGKGKTNALLNLIQQDNNISLIRFICMQQIWKNQNINFSLKKESKQE